MKHILIVILVFSLSGTALAQFTKGRMLAGGSVSLSSTTDKTKSGGATTTNGKTTSFTVNPKAGYFIIDNLAVGAGLDISLSSYKPEGSGNKFSSTGLALAPFVRYYLDQGIYFQGTFGFGSNKTKTTAGNTTTTNKNNLSLWSLGAGYAYFLNDHVAVEPFVGYQSTTLGSGGTKQIDGQLFLQAGFQIYLDKK